MAAALLELPTELIVFIFCHLSLRDLKSCKQLCRRLRTLIEQSQLLQCHLRTMLSGVEDLFLPGVCSADFLKGLERWEAAWQRFDIGEHFARCRYNNVMWSVDHIVQNGYVAAMRLGDSGWHSAPGWSYADISRISSEASKGSKEFNWTDIQFDMNYTPKGFVLDVNQDLVAVASYRGDAFGRFQLHFLRFTTGERHPLASDVSYDLEMNCKYPTECEMGMEIMDQHLIIVVTYKPWHLPRRRQRVYIVNWKSGQLRCLRRARNGTYFPVVTFMSNSLVVLARQRDFALEICRITGGTETSPGRSLQTVCILKLPTPHPKARLQFKMCSRTPPNQSSPSSILNSSRLPFRSSPADTILGFDIDVRRYGKPSADLRRLSFWTHPSTLCSLAAEADKHTRATQTEKTHRGARGLASRLFGRVKHAFAGPPVLQWQEWGPESTRWRESLLSLRDRHALSGTRCAIVEQDNLALHLI
ncbi:hypothetical protein BC834DRAFT_155024 [Gloeopeniophorella convolvens]|nr:hypothetical protein BC834DRAFT_155024 [Gloeopeniophorella convolvens]